MITIPSHKPDPTPSQVSLLALIHTLNHNLNTPLLRIRRNLESLNGILQLEPVRNKPTQIDNPTLQQPNRPRPSVRITVLELQIHLARAQAHERNLNLGSTNTNDEDLAAELGRVDGSRDGRLHARALHGDGGLDAVGELDHFLRELLGGVVEVDLVRADGGAEFLRERQAALVDVRDDDGFCARGFDAGEGDEADGAGAADEHGVAEGDVGALHAGEGDGEGFKKSAVLVAHVADLVAPDGRVVDVAAQQAGDGRRAAELDRLASVVFACQAGFALAADDVGFDGDAVADVVRFDRRVFGHHDTGGFVAEHVRVFHDHGADGAVFPEVDI